MARYHSSHYLTNYNAFLPVQVPALVAHGRNLTNYNVLLSVQKVPALVAHGRNLINYNALLPVQVPALVAHGRKRTAVLIVPAVSDRLPLVKTHTHTHTGMRLVHEQLDLSFVQRHSHVTGANLLLDDHSGASQ